MHQTSSEVLPNLASLFKYFYMLMLAYWTSNSDKIHGFQNPIFSFYTNMSIMTFSHEELFTNGSTNLLSLICHHLINDDH